MLSTFSTPGRINMPEKPLDEGQRRELHGLLASLVEGKNPDIRS